MAGQARKRWDGPVPGLRLLMGFRRLGLREQPTGECGKAQGPCAQRSGPVPPLSSLKVLNYSFLGRCSQFSAVIVKNIDKSEASGAVLKGGLIVFGL